MIAECAHEQDVLDVVATRRWPDRCSAELQAHISECAACRDLAGTAAALLDEQEAAWSEARVPTSGVVWWRAQARAREEAVRAAARPIAFVQGVAATCAVWLAVSLLRAFPPAGVLNWRGWIPALPNAGPDLSRLAAAIPGGLPFIVAAIASLLLAPIALFLLVRQALREE
jgi:hypothetical protein